jgi:hypothetical protein
MSSLKTCVGDTLKRIDQTAANFRNTKFLINKIRDILSGNCLGCCEQCPFCSAACSLSVADHWNPNDPKGSKGHSALQHYPQGVYGATCEGKLYVDVCTTVITDKKQTFRCEKGTFKYREYEKAYPEWNIPRDESMNTSLFWKWFMVTYKHDLVKMYEDRKAKLPDIPRSWMLITKSQAVASLRSAQ